MSEKVLVIGGSSGIGKQVVEDLVTQHYEVIAASRNINQSDFSNGVEVQAIDVTKDFQLDLPDKLAGLVYCPGTINLRPFNRIKLQDIQNEMDINYFGAIRVLHQSIDKLKNGEGSVVFFSTVAVQTGMPFHSTISSAKGAIEGLTRSLAAEYAPKVRFNAIAPSLTETPLSQGLLNNDRKRESNSERHPLKKIGTANDISNMATYLISDKSSWVTGQIFHIDGGMSSVRSL
jgi:NAD(P)-dependent dehydrogenase (short-subunit alcohol dehydrogenase family)